MKDKLLKIWQLSNTKQFAGIFEEYMKELGVRKYDGGRKDKNQYSCDKEFQARALVNANKQRECMYFIKKVK
ncbi:hypothetical protein ACSXBD_04545 [Clostridium perfringens]